MPLEIGKAQKLTSPNPFCLVSSRKPDGTTNLMALSWWTYVSNHPPMVCIALSTKGFSHTLIQESGEFAINIVGDGLQKAAFHCGTCSGRDRDKAAEFDIDLKNANVIGCQVVANTRAVLECQVEQVVPAADHILFLAKVLDTTLDPQIPALYAMDGYARLETV